MKTSYRFIRFEPMHFSGWTHACVTVRGGETLGYVRWYERWLEHEYLPRERSAYTTECLRDIADFLRQCNEERVRRAEDRP